MFSASSHASDAATIGLRGKATAMPVGELERSAPRSPPTAIDIHGVCVCLGEQHPGEAGALDVTRERRRPLPCRRTDHQVESHRPSLPAPDQRGSSRSMFQWRDTAVIHAPSPRGISAKRLIVCWPPS